jgi:hypothetical protein
MKSTNGIGIASGVSAHCKDANNGWHQKFCVNEIVQPSFCDITNTNLSGHIWLFHFSAVTRGFKGPRYPC